jgi:hypothetical protein
MKRGRKWWLLRVAVPLVAGLVLFVWAIQQSSQNVVIVENRSGQTITLLQITRDGQTTTFPDVPAGGEVKAVSKTPSAFKVEGRLANGNRIAGHFKEIGPRADLIVLPGGQLTLRKSKD